MLRENIGLVHFCSLTLKAFPRSLIMENIYTKSRWFFWYLKFFGFFSVSFDGPVCHGRIEIKMKDKVLLVIKVFLAIFFIATNSTFPASNDCCQSEMASTAWNLISISEVFAALLLFIHQWKKYDAIIGFYHHLNEIDARVSLLLDSYPISFNLIFIVAGCSQIYVNE